MPTKMNIMNNDKDDDIKSNIELLKLSASSMKTFDQCPRKYYYNYIERAPRRQWAHFDLGNLCHKALELFHEIYLEKGAANLGKLMGYCFAEARKEFPDMNDDLVAEAKGLLTKYLQNIKQIGMPPVIGVETSFNFQISDDVLVRGFLDRVDKKKDGTFHIVDYKTTKNEKYLDSFQLLVYGLWLQKEYPHINEFEASYILLRHNSKLKSYRFNSHDVDKAKQKILKFASNIRASDATDNWTPVPSRLCNWCDFQNICPTQGW